MDRATEPANVSIILADAVRVRRAPPALVASLERRGFRPARTRGVVEIPYRRSDDAGNLEHQSLVEVLQALARLGVSFLRDPRQAWSPADVVAALLAEGVEFERPRATSFDGHAWRLVDHPWSTA